MPVHFRFSSPYGAFLSETMSRCREVRHSKESYPWAQITDHSLCEDYWFGQKVTNEWLSCNKWLLLTAISTYESKVTLCCRMPQNVQYTAQQVFNIRYPGFINVVSNILRLLIQELRLNFEYLKSSRKLVVRCKQKNISLMKYFGTYVFKGEQLVLPSSVSTLFTFKCL